MPTTCPIGHRHETRDAATAAISYQQARSRKTRARRKAVHCPDCRGFHVITFSRGTLRRRNPRQVARLERAGKL